MAARPLENHDLLDWFAFEERQLCGSCGDRACVTLPEAASSFCLVRGAVLVGGVRIDRGTVSAG